MTTLVRGPIKLVTDRPDTVRKINLRAPALRLHGAGIVTDHNDDIPVRDGQVEFEALPGPAVLTLVTAGGEPLRSVDIVVPDEDTATLSECLDQIYVYDPPVVGRAQQFAREAGEHADRAEAGAARVGSAEQVGAWVEEAAALRGPTVEAADRAQTQAGVATEQAGVAAGHAKQAGEDRAQTGADRRQTGEDRAQTGKDVEAAEGWASQSKDAATLAITSAAALERHVADRAPTDDDTAYPGAVWVAPNHVWIRGEDAWHPISANDIDKNYVDAQDQALGERIDDEKWYRGSAPVDADTLFHPGSYNIKDSRSSGLPFGGIGNLQVLAVAAGAAQIAYDWNRQEFWHRRSSGGVYGAWERMPKNGDIPTTDDIISRLPDIPTAEEIIDHLPTGTEGMKLVPLAVTTGAPISDGATRGNFRILTQFTAPITRFRVHISTAHTLASSPRDGAQLWLASVGHHAGSGGMKNQQTLHSGTMNIPAGGEWVSGWVRHDLSEESIIEFSFTSQGRTFNMLAPAWELQDDGSRKQVSRAPLWVWLEAETYQQTPTVALLGDSTGAGHGSTAPVLDAPVAISGRKQGFLPVLYASSGDSLAGNTNPNDRNFIRWSGYGPYDSVIIQAGSNDIHGGTALEQIKSNFAAVVDAVGQLSNTIFAATVKPRYPASSEYDATRIAYNSWLNTRPEGVRDVIDFSDALAPDGEVAEEHNDDGSHVNSAGHHAMASAFTFPICRPRVDHSWVV